jgi:hypothetical protein
MKKTNGRMILFIIIAFFTILAVSAWGEVKKPVGTANNTMTQQARAVANQMLTGVRGHVKNSIGMMGKEGVEMMLYEGNAGSPVWQKSSKTDSAGSYSFGNLTDKVGKTLKIAAGSGLGQIPFSPNNIEFVLVSGINTMKDIYYTQLNVPITVKVWTPDSVAISGVKVTEYYVLNGQDIALESKITTNDGYCKFININEANIGKDFVIKPNDPKYQSFNPVEKRFKLANSSPIDFYFTYTGPLPDLIVSAVSEKADKIHTSKVSFVVTNQGNAPSGPCYLMFKYKEVDFYGRTKLDPPDVHSYIPALAPGASYTDEGVTRSFADWMINLFGYMVDYENVVGESNGNNNAH